MSEFENQLGTDGLDNIINRLSHYTAEPNPEHPSATERIQIPEGVARGELVRHVSGAYLAELAEVENHAGALNNVEHLMPQVRAAQVAEVQAWIEQQPPDSDARMYGSLLIDSEKGKPRFMNDRAQRVLDVLAENNPTLYAQMRVVCANAAGGNFYRDELVGQPLAHARALGAVDDISYSPSLDDQIVKKVNRGAFVPFAMGPDREAFIEAYTYPDLKLSPPPPSAS